MHVQQEEILLQKEHHRKARGGGGNVKSKGKRKKNADGYASATVRAAF
jgi:hypothetical protein